MAVLHDRACTRDVINDGARSGSAPVEANVIFSPDIY
jgi:hypothetical protein